MNKISKLAGALLLGAGALGLAGCATGLRTQVSRYQAMPAPAGQTFYVVPAEGQPRNARVQPLCGAGRAAARRPRATRRPARPQLASMLVKLDYGVDEGKTEYSVDPFARSRYGYGGFGYGDPFYRSRFGRYGGYLRPVLRRLLSAGRTGRAWRLLRPPLALLLRLGRPVLV